jgi:hypothetical protein
MRSLSGYVNLVAALAPRSPTGGITMAKNKNRDRKQPQTERGQQQAPHSSTEATAEHRMSPVTPGDVARKDKHKRFGHN